MLHYFFITTATLHRIIRANTTLKISYVCAQLHPTLGDPMDLHAPLSMDFSRQEFGSWLPFPAPGGLPDSGIEPASLVSLALASRFFTTMPAGKPCASTRLQLNKKSPHFFNAHYNYKQILTHSALTTTSG